VNIDTELDLLIAETLLERGWAEPLPASRAGCAASAS